MELARARIAEDERLIKVVESYDEAALRAPHSYKTTSGMPHSQVLGDILMRLFNHLTHHRGQAHACLSVLTGSEPPSLDLLLFGGVARPQIWRSLLRGEPMLVSRLLLGTLAKARALAAPKLVRCNIPAPTRRR